MILLCIYYGSVLNNIISIVKSFFMSFVYIIYENLYLYYIATQQKNINYTIEQLFRFCQCWF